MIIDQQTLFSNAQLLTTTAVSTNVLDLGVARDMGVGDDDALDMLCRVVTAFTGGTSLQAVLQTSTDNSTFNTLASGPVVALANLVVGADLWAGYLPMNMGGLALGRYLRINYVIVGTMTAGAVTAGLILDRQYNLAYTPGLAIAN